jgi:hypothetical protein
MIGAIVFRCGSDSIAIGVSRYAHRGGTAPTAGDEIFARRVL